MPAAMLWVLKRRALAFMCSLALSQVLELNTSTIEVILIRTGPLGKIPNGGRGWEGFSPDPYLTGIAMQQTIGGMQVSISWSWSIGILH